MDSGFAATASNFTTGETGRRSMRFLGYTHELPGHGGAAVIDFLARRGLRVPGGGFRISTAFQCADIRSSADHHWASPGIASLPGFQILEVRGTGLEPPRFNYRCG